MNRFRKFFQQLNKIPDNYGLLLVIFLQCVLIACVFDKIIFHDTQYVFSSVQDGAKNYFTLQGYVDQQKQDDYLKFGLMNYPYGDYIYYTDNTPLFALLERITLHGTSQAAHAIYYFNLLILLGLVFSSVILFRLFRKFSVGALLAVVFSIGLPWLCPQAMRLGGHFNLTLSFIPLLVIYLLVRQEKKVMVWRDTTLVLVMVLAAFVHVYYLLLSLVFVFSFFCFTAFEYAWEKRPWKTIFLCGLGICASALILFFLILRFTDDYYPMRRNVAEGYDFDGWKLQLRGFYTPYFFHPLSKLFSVEPVPYESFAYLGTGTLLGIAGLLGFFLINPKQLKLHFAEIKRSPYFSIIIVLFVASIPGVLIALGERVHLFGNVTATNYLNPFLFLRKFVPQVAHFRCLGRFSWFFFWTANILLLVTVVSLLSKRYFRVLLLLMFCGFVADIYYSLKTASVAYETQNPFDRRILHEAAQKFGAINTAEYQAMLAFPFYHVGSENYHYTIDPEDAYCIRTMQLSLASGLPLINSKMSRTPLQYTYNIFSLFEESVNDTLLQAFNSKPILVYLEKSFYAADTLIAGTTPSVGEMPAKEFSLHGHEIIRKYGMKTLFENEDYAWYEWTPSINNQ